MFIIEKNYLKSWANIDLLVTACQDRQAANPSSKDKLVWLCFRYSHYYFRNMIFLFFSIINIFGLTFKNTDCYSKKELMHV